MRNILLEFLTHLSSYYELLGTSTKSLSLHGEVCAMVKKSTKIGNRQISRNKSKLHVDCEVYKGLKWLQLKNLKKKLGTFFWSHKL